MRQSNTADSDLLHPRRSLRGREKEKLLTFVSPNQSQRDPRGSSSHHNFQSKGFLIYKRKLQMFIFTAGALRPVMDNRWKLSRRTQEAAIPTGWVEEKSGSRRNEVYRLNSRIGRKYLASARLSGQKLLEALSTCSITPEIRATAPPISSLIQQQQGMSECWKRLQRSRLEIGWLF